MGLRNLLGMTGADSGAEAGTGHASKEKDFHATIWLPPPSISDDPPSPSSPRMLPQGDLEYLSYIRWKKKWNRRKLCYCIWNLPEKFPLFSSWKIVLIWNMKLLSSLLSQRREQKAMLLGFSGGAGGGGRSRAPEIVCRNCPCASTLQIFLFSSLAASPSKICLSLTDSSETRGSSWGSSRVPASDRTSRLILSWTLIWMH